MTDNAALPAVLVERRDKVMIITINRPEARNAVNMAVSVGVGDALAEAEADRGGSWALNAQEAKALFHSRDAQEGPRAFAEKRTPVWEAQ